MIKILIKLTLSLIILAGVMFSVPAYAYAQCSPATEGDCVNGYICVCGEIEESDGSTQTYCYRDSAQYCGSEKGLQVIGPIRAPDAVARFNIISTSHVGLVPFLSIIIRLITIVAGIFTMLNFVAAGAKYVFSMGNTNANVEVRDKLLFSVIGLLIIVASYTIAALFGLIFFGDATFILRPTFTGALDL